MWSRRLPDGFFFCDPRRQSKRARTTRISNILRRLSRINAAERGKERDLVQKIVCADLLTNFKSSAHTRFHNDPSPEFAGALEDRSHVEPALTYRRESRRRAAVYSVVRLVAHVRGEARSELSGTRKSRDDRDSKSVNRQRESTLCLKAESEDDPQQHHQTREP